MNSEDYMATMIDLGKSMKEKGLISGDFGNMSIRSNNNCFITSSGSHLESLQQSDFASVSISDGNFQPSYYPSSDLRTHLELYRHFSQINGIVHTHSLYATAWAQAGIPILCLGTTHADYWNGEIPVTRRLKKDEVSADYEAETGKVIVEKLRELEIDILECPGILVFNHAPFTWGNTIEEAVKHAEMLEYVAKLAWLTLEINPEAKSISPTLIDRHFFRKHGPDAYYGNVPE